jgi:hypothetical protein
MVGNELVHSILTLEPVFGIKVTVLEEVAPLKLDKVIEDADE